MNLAKKLNYGISSRNHLDVIKWLQSTFEKKLMDAIQITADHPKLVKASPKEMNNIYNIFLKNGFSKDTFTYHPWIFGLKEKMVTYKLEENDIHRVTSNDLPLINTSINSYSKIISNWKEDLNYIGAHENRLFYFVKNLDSSRIDMTNIMNKHTPLVTLNIHKIIRIMNILKEYQVDSSFILADMYIFRHNEDTILHRCQLCKQHTKLIKPWMLRCTEPAFKILLNNWIEEKDALKNCKDKFEFLAAELEVDEDYIKERYFFEGSTFDHSTTRKLKKVIDYLKSKGYSSTEITDTFRILGYGLERIETRIKQMESIGVKPALTDILHSKTVFNERIRKYKQTRNK